MKSLRACMVMDVQDNRKKLITINIMIFSVSTKKHNLKILKRHIINLLLKNIQTKEVILKNLNLLQLLTKCLVIKKKEILTTNMVKKVYKEEVEWVEEIYSHKCLEEEWEEEVKDQKKVNLYNMLSNVPLKKFIKAKVQKLQ